MDATLLAIARSGKTAPLEQIVEQNNFALSSRTPKKDTALHIAVRLGHCFFAVEIVKRCPSLLFAQNVRGDTALHIAARTGSSNVVHELIECARNMSGSQDSIIMEMVRKRNTEQNTLLHEAASNGHEMVVWLLLREDPELALLVNGAGASPLYLAAENGPAESVDHFISYSCSTGRRTYGGPHNRTPMHAAVLGGHLDILKKFIKEMPQLIKHTDVYWNSPLHYAASLGNAEMVRELMQSDASIPHLVDSNGRSAFLMAASNGHINVMQVLLQLCPDSGEVVDGKGWNALHIAVEMEKADVVRYILETKELEELINEPNDEGNTPLHLSIIRRNIPILYLLSKNGRVDMRAVNHNSETALDIAESDNELSMKFRKVQKNQADENIHQIVICSALTLAGAQRGKRQQDLEGNRTHLKPRAAPRIESYKAMSKVILVVAGLIITVTFTAAFTTPGGPIKGPATITRKAAFWAFMITDAVALFSSIIVSLLLIWAGIGDHDLLVGAISIATRLMAVAIGSLSLAFLSGLWLVLPMWLCFAILLISIGIFCLSLLSFCSQFSFLVLFYKWNLSNCLLSQFIIHCIPQSSELEQRIKVLSSRTTRYHVTDLAPLLVDSQPIQ